MSSTGSHSKPTQATEWFEAHRPAFLRALRASVNATFAARVAGVNRQQMYEYRKILPSFADEWQEAVDRNYVDFLTRYTRRKVDVDTGADSAQDSGAMTEQIDSL